MLEGHSYCLQQDQAWVVLFSFSAWRFSFVSWWFIHFISSHVTTSVLYSQFLHSIIHQLHLLYTTGQWYWCIGCLQWVIFYIITFSVTHVECKYVCTYNIFVLTKQHIPIYIQLNILTHQRTKGSWETIYRFCLIFTTVKRFGFDKHKISQVPIWGNVLYEVPEGSTCVHTSPELNQIITELQWHLWYVEWLQNEDVTVHNGACFVNKSQCNT